MFNHCSSHGTPGSAPSRNKALLFAHPNPHAGAEGGDNAARHVDGACIWLPERRLGGTHGRQGVDTTCFKPSVALTPHMQHIQAHARTSTHLGALAYVDTASYAHVPTCTPPPSQLESLSVSSSAEESIQDAIGDMMKQLNKAGNDTSMSTSRYEGNKWGVAIKALVGGCGAVQSLPIVAERWLRHDQALNDTVCLQ